MELKVLVTLTQFIAKNCAQKRRYCALCAQTCEIARNRHCCAQTGANCAQQNMGCAAYSKQTVAPLQWTNIILRMQNLSAKQWSLLSLFSTLVRTTIFPLNYNLPWYGTYSLFHLKARYIYTFSPIPNGTKFLCTTIHSLALAVISRAGVMKVCTVWDGADSGADTKIQPGVT